MDINNILSSYPSIEKKIHITWKNKNIIYANYNIIKNGILLLKNLNPDYEFNIYDDNDVEEYLKKYISDADYILIKDKKIVEKIDLWRLLIIYNEGGVYQDIDRLCNIPLSKIINSKTKCILPMWLDYDFSQDIMISCSKNIIHKRAIELNLERRRNNSSAPILYLGPETYFNAITEILLGYQLSPGPSKIHLAMLRNIIKKSPYLETYRESPLFNTILYKGSTINDDKLLMYKNEGVVQWFK